eukprot:PhM_4_TR18823/c0_g1_i1/m.48374
MVRGAIHHCLNFIVAHKVVDSPAHSPALGVREHVQDVARETHAHFEDLVIDLWLRTTCPNEIQDVDDAFHERRGVAFQALEDASVGLADGGDEVNLEVVHLIIVDVEAAGDGGGGLQDIENHVEILGEASAQMKSNITEARNDCRADVSRNLLSAEGTCEAAHDLVNEGLGDGLTERGENISNGRDGDAQNVAVVGGGKALVEVARHWEEEALEVVAKSEGEGTDGHHDLLVHLLADLQNTLERTHDHLRLLLRDVIVQLAHNVLQRAGHEALHLSHILDLLGGRVRAHELEGAVDAVDEFRDEGLYDLEAVGGGTRQQSVHGLLAGGAETTLVRVVAIHCLDKGIHDAPEVLRDGVGLWQLIVVLEEHTDVVDDGARLVRNRRRVAHQRDGGAHHVVKAHTHNDLGVEAGDAGNGPDGGVAHERVLLGTDVAQERRKGALDDAADRGRVGALDDGGEGHHTGLAVPPVRRGNVVVDERHDVAADVVAEDGGKATEAHAGRRRHIPVLVGLALLLLEQRLQCHGNDARGGALGVALELEVLRQGLVGFLVRVLLLEEVHLNVTDSAPEQEAVHDGGLVVRVTKRARGDIEDAVHVRL